MSRVTGAGPASVIADANHGQGTKHSDSMPASILMVRPRSAGPGPGSCLIREFGKHGSQDVDAAEDGVDPGRRHRQAMRAKLVQKAFEIVSPTYEVARFQKALPRP